MVLTSPMIFAQTDGIVSVLLDPHIVPHKKFDRIGGTSSSTFADFKYGGPREICVE